METKTEVKFLSKFADVVGMTMANEATLAQETKIKYAAFCSVDNYAHGVEKEINISTAIKNAHENAQKIHEILNLLASEIR